MGQKLFENLKLVIAFEENIRGYSDLKGIMVEFLYLEQLFGVAFTKSERRDWHLI